MEVSLSLLIFFVFLLKPVKPQFSQPGLCVTKCICILQTDRMVACNKGDYVTAIPVNVPSKYSRLMIQNSEFQSPTIYKYNMTGLEHINYLKIVYCGVEAVEELAFENMQKLEYLDLSHNHIKVISPYTFTGLHLKSLHLMENAGMKLDIKSFTGLKVKEMNLRSNLITKLYSTQFLDIGVEKLYLFNNSLRSLDQSLADIFDKPNHLIDVTKNPLHCDCHLRWLAKNLRQQSADSVKYVNITCSSPLALHQRSLISLTDNDLNCPQPHIHSLSVDFSTLQTQLSCSATSSFREAEIAWTYEENGQQKEFRKIRSLGDFNPKQYDTISNTHFSVNVTIPANEKRTFTCSTWTKDSEPQRVTVQIRTPQIEFPRTPVKSSKTNNQDRINSPTIDDSNYLFTKQFTILEMIGAVVGTFALTVFFLFLVARFIRLYRYKLAKTASLKPYWPHNPGHDSMYSQPISNGDYDIPRVCETHTFPPPPSFDHIEFLDFKNHNKLFPNVP